RGRFFRDPRALAGFEQLDDADDLAPLDLARRRARQLHVGEEERLDALVERQRRGDFAEVVLYPAVDFVALEADVRVVVGDDEARDLLADAFGEADHAEFFDVGRILVEFFDLVRVDVLAVRVDDDLFRAADEVEVAFVVESSEVARVEPAPGERALRRLLVLVVAEHDVVAARDDLADAGGVRFGDADFDAGQGLADARRVQAVLRARYGQHRRGLGQAVAFEDGKAQPVHVALDLLVQGRAA